MNPFDDTSNLFDITLSDSPSKEQPRSETPKDENNEDPLVKVENSKLLLNEISQDFKTLQVHLVLLDPVAKECMKTLSDLFLDVEDMVTRIDSLEDQQIGFVQQHFNEVMAVRKKLDLLKRLAKTSTISDESARNAEIQAISFAYYEEFPEDFIDID